MCWRHYSEGLREYRQGAAVAKGNHPQRCRALVHVAKDDLKAAIQNIPEIRDQTEACDALSLLQSVYDQTSSQ